MHVHTYTHFIGVSRLSSSILGQSWAEPGPGVLANGQGLARPAGVCLSQCVVKPGCLRQATDANSAEGLSVSYS